MTRDGKEPSLLEFGSFRVLPNIRVRSVRVLSSYRKMKVRFLFGSLCRVFGSVRFGSTRVLIHIYLVYMLTIYIEYTMRVKKIFSRFSDIFPKRLGIFSPHFTCLFHYFSYLR